MFGQLFLLARQDLAFCAMSLKNPEQSGTKANGIIVDRPVACLCSRGGTFLDIGAQYGANFAAALRHDPTMNIIAFEAEPHNAAKLEELLSR